MDQIKIRVGDPMGLRSKDLSKFQWADICPYQYKASISYSSRKH